MAILDPELESLTDELVIDGQDLVDAVDAAEAEAQARRDVWAWITAAVSTVDEVDRLTPIKPFPTATCGACARYIGGRPTACDRCRGPVTPIAYLPHLARQWQRADPPILLVPKARRMRLTWLYVACHLWLALTQRHANVFFVSSKEEKSAELVERARGILARLPRTGALWAPSVSKQSPPTLAFPDLGSTILGIAEGPEQLRQYTSTAILADEFGTYMNPRAAYSAMKPTLEGGGRLTIVSSAWPGAWAEMVRGELLA
jgi:hypothetical protein